MPAADRVTTVGPVCAADRVAVTVTSAEPSSSPTLDGDTLKVIVGVCAATSATAAATMKATASGRRRGHDERRPRRR